MTKKIICAKHAKALLNLHSAYSGTAQNYRRLINEVSSNTAAIEGLNTGVSSHEIILMEAILNSKKAHDRQDWEVRTASSDFPKLQNLIDFLESKCQALEVIDFGKISVANKPKSCTYSSGAFNTKRAHVASVSSKHTCIYCHKGHNITKCDSFKSLHVNTRRFFVNNNHLCFQCLISGHRASQCNAQPCSECSGRLNVLLHRHNEQLDQGSNASEVASVHSSLKGNRSTRHTYHFAPRFLLARSSEPIPNTVSGSCIWRPPENGRPPYTSIPTAPTNLSRRSQGLGRLPAAVPARYGPADQAQEPVCDSEGPGLQAEVTSRPPSPTSSSASSSDTLILSDAVLLW
jgi:hypothetical protein